MLRLKQLSGPLDPGGLSDGQEPFSLDGQVSAEIVRLIGEMDLAEGIAAARAFSLYFQLVNILEQHIEEDSYIESLKLASTPAASDPFLPALASQSEPATFRQLFERLRSLNVPPARLEQLLQDLEIGRAHV